MPRGSPPVGTVTFLFTDIEGSTKLWEAHPETMRVSLARHDALMREAIAASNGYVFKTIGDAFCAAFATAPEAVEAVLNAQLSLAAEPWPEETPIRVRMALHTGAVESRDDDYFGPPVNRVARLLSTAHGGQSVLSQPTCELVRDALPPQSAVRDLGVHQLKDLARPEQVYQLNHPLLRAEFPPIRSLSTHPNNLPQQLTSFIGREKETEELKSLLAKSRLVTLIGSGGTGKTRLSLQVAADVLEKYPDGIWFVELAPLSEPTLVARTLADVLSVKEQAGEPVMATLVRFLKDKKLLVVLDNCEHLVASCASLVHEILQKCPDVQVLASSREALGIAGEQTYRVPSLSLPDPKRLQTPETLSHYESVRLFVERAVLAKSDFQVTNQNAPALASVCYQLDGIPLAIELAAARLKLLTVEDIDSRLDQRFRLLTGGSRTALPRQQTLKALVDWSYDLLGDAEKALLCRLSVFAGGWTLEAAEAVCSGDPIEDWETLDLMASLSDKSLVVSDSWEGSARYRLLETVRQYARDRLLEGGEELKWRERHLAHFLALTESAEKELRGPDQDKWLNLLEEEHDNIRAALDWATESSVPFDHSIAGLRVAGAIWRFWLIRGFLTEGREKLSKALARVGEGNEGERSKALNGAAGLAHFQGDRAIARQLSEECLAIRRNQGDLIGIADGLGNLGTIAFDQGDFETARVLIEEGLALREEIGDRKGIGNSMSNLGSVLYHQGNYADAQALFEQSLEIRKEFNDRRGTGISLINLGVIAIDHGDPDKARSYLREALALHQSVGDSRSATHCLESFAEISPNEIAARLWGFAERMREQLGAPLPQFERKKHEESIAANRAAYQNDAAFDEAWSEGRDMTLEQAVALALTDSD